MAKRSSGNVGVAGDVYPDKETLHPSDPDGNPEGLAPDDTRDTEADPTPNTQEAAEANPGKGLLDQFEVSDPPAPARGPGRTPNPRTIAARDFLKAHPNQFVKVGIYSKAGSVPEMLRVIDGKRVVTRWVPTDDGQFTLHMKLTNEDYVKRVHKKRATPSVDSESTTDGVEHEDAVQAEQEAQPTA